MGAPRTGAPVHWNAVEALKLPRRYALRNDAAYAAPAILHTGRCNLAYMLRSIASIFRRTSSICSRFRFSYRSLS
ncbi:hypothetical protein BTO02_06700 [Paraburkholderia sp. SOS3]|nr:hypothetical protein BTO02_06700 [Paraburkholderia sp. SOS3]